MREELIIEDLVPLSKPRPRFSRTGRTYTPPKYQDYEDYIARQYKGYCFQDNIKINLIFDFKVPASYSKKKAQEALEGNLRPSSKDLDNLVKGVLDALNKVAWRDDRYIYYIQAEKRYSDNNRITIKIEGE